LIKEHCA